MMPCQLVFPSAICVIAEVQNDKIQALVRVMAAIGGCSPESSQTFAVPEAAG